MDVAEHKEETVTHEAPNDAVKALRERTQLGIAVAVALTVLTIIEYFIAVNVDNPTIWLVPFAIGKAALILEFFMHFSALIGGGDH